MPSFLLDIRIYKVLVTCPPNQPLEFVQFLEPSVIPEYLSLSLCYYNGGF